MQAALAAPPGTAPAERITAPPVVSIDSEIDVDGVLDEPAWERAQPVTDFLRFQPIAGGPPPGHTQVRFLQDDRYLYVGVRITQADYPIRARVSRREDINADDQVGIYLDTFRDERTGYIFYFNGRGIQQDIRVGPGFSSFDWNTVLRTGGQVHDDGFTLEVAIPWRSLKYPSTDGDEPQTWGLILTRKIPSEGAKYSFPTTQRNHPRLFTQAARLPGVRPPPRGSGLEITPSLTVIQQASRDPVSDELSWIDLNPRRQGATGRWLQVVRPSLDARLGLTPNMGLAATLNPDFSQVDQDPTFIDLNQRFAFFLPERRPFFLDGTEYFADQHGTLYSRSIVDPLYGFKLSGRAGPWSVGALHSLDRSPAPSVHERPTPGFGPDDVDGAWAANEIARARVDAFGDGYVGASFADKRVVGPDREQRGAHTSVGVDTRIPLDDRWTLDARTQQSLTGDDPRELMWGQDVGVAVQRAGGIGLGTSLAISDKTLGFRRETGFLNQSGITNGAGSLNYTFEPLGGVDTVTPGVEASGRVERNGEYQGVGGGSVSMRVGGIHSLSAWAGASRTAEGIEDADTGKAEDLVVVDGPYGGGSYSAELGRVLAVAGSFELQRVLDFANLAPADAFVSTATLTLRPTPGLRLDTTGRADRLARPDDSVARAGLIRHWTSWQFTKELGLRSMVEWSAGNERDDRLVTTVLLTWLENPGTAVHVGWIERTLLEGAPKTQDRSVFFKVSVLFRP